MSDSINFRKVTVLPTTFEPDAVYMVPVDDETFSIFVADKTGTSIRKCGGSDGVPASDIVVVAETAPDATTATAPFFWSSAENLLYIRYKASETAAWAWVRATDLPEVPEFGGNGEAETMSRSDHTHSSLQLVENQW